MSYFFTITQLRVGFMILSSITNYGNLNHLNTNMVVNGNEWYWVTSTIMTVWTGLYTWHYIISIFFCFFFGVLSLGRENGMISGPAVLKSLWNDLDVVIGQLKWVWQPKCIFQYCQPQLGCWELKSDADLLCEIWVCWQVLIRVVVKIKAAVWNVK